MKLKFTLELKNYLNVKSQTIQEYSRKKCCGGAREDVGRHFITKPSTHTILRIN
jgi:hypothetical protein